MDARWVAAASLLRAASGLKNSGNLALARGREGGEIVSVRRARLLDVLADLRDDGRPGGFAYAGFNSISGKIAIYPEVEVENLLTIG